MNQAPKIETPRLSFEPEMIFIQGGTFKMGGDMFDYEKPIHEVTVPDFYIGKYPVTFAEYDAYCEATNIEKPSDQTWGRDRRPVINVSWEDATAYCKWLSEKTDKKYRLPTEAEWEYAARGGNKSKGYEYSGSNNLDEVGWYDKNQTHSVGEKKPNELDIHDMSGNVWEWCSDWYSSDYYTQRGNSSNPTGPAKGSYRVLRGGSWLNSAQGCRAAYRNFSTLAFRDYTVGFRLAR